VPTRRAMSRRLHRKALPKPASACWPSAPTAVGGSFYLTAKVGLALPSNTPRMAYGYVAADSSFVISV